MTSLQIQTTTKQLQKCPTESLGVGDGFGFGTGSNMNTTPVPVVVPLPSPCINGHGQNMMDKRDSLQIQNSVGTFQLDVEMGSFMLNRAGSNGMIAKSLTNTTMIDNMVMEDIMEEMNTPQGLNEDQDTDLDEEYGESGSKINESVSNTALQAQVMDMTIDRVNSATYDPEVLDDDEIDAITPFGD